MSRRVSFSPEPTTSLYTKPGATKDSGGNKKRMVLKIWTFKLPKGSRFSPARFFRHISAKVVRAQRFASARRQCWHKVSSASLTKSHSYVETLDSHRAEAIEDCIEFLNSSNASLQRSNSARSSWQQKQDNYFALSSLWSSNSGACGSSNSSSKVLPVPKFSGSVSSLFRAMGIIKSKILNLRKQKSR